MPPTNQAAYYPSNKAPTLQIGTAPYPTPSADEVIIKVSAAAINHIDHKLQDSGTDVLPFLTYPLIGGLDASGTIAEVGSRVSRFRPGDRVLGFPTEFASRAGAFQHYVAVPAQLTARVPDDASLVNAAVLPSALAAAAVALHQYLGLSLPTTPPRARNGEAVLVTAGASSVGSNAIQLAAAAGYEVYTTSSAQHFEHCAALGAARVFNYRSPSVAQDLKDALQGRRLAGAVSCVEGSNALAFDVAGSVDGNKRVACMMLFAAESVPAGIAAEMIHAYWIKDTALADAIFGSFLPEALASGQYKYEPKPRVVGEGLQSIQAAFDVGKTNSVSCEKLVVILEAEA